MNSNDKLTAATAIGTARPAAARPAGEPAEGLGFERIKAPPRMFSDAKIDGLLERARGSGFARATISGQALDNRIRRSEVMWLRRSEGYGWLYERIWPAITKLNASCFGFDITGFNGSIQLARYAAGDAGFYDWHMDNGDKNAGRKISLSVQLSHSEDYEGGELELWFKTRPRAAPRQRGAIIAFPSFVMHRVMPVTRGERYSLVAWIIGPRWR